MAPYKYQCRTFASHSPSPRQVPFCFQPPCSTLFPRSPLASFSTMFCFHLITLALCVLPALAAPTPLLRISKAETPLPGRYIVTLKQGTSNGTDVTTFSSTMSASSNITHRWDSMGSFAGELSEDDLETLRADPRVDAIEEDGIMKALGTVTQCVPFTQFRSAPVTSADVHRTQSGLTLPGA